MSLTSGWARRVGICPSEQNVGNVPKLGGCSPQKPRGDEGGDCSKGHAIASDLLFLLLTIHKICMKGGMSVF